MKKNDIFLLIGITLAALLLLFALNLFPQEKSEVVIMVNGTEKVRLPLDKDAEYDTGGNIIAIEDGKAFMKSADCPDKLCIKQGPVNACGTPIVCLPNKVVVYIE